MTEWTRNDLERIGAAAICVKNQEEREKDHMEFTKLGNTGMDVSRICLGCMGFGDAERWIHKWVLNEENSRPIIKKTLEQGINFLDTPTSIPFEKVGRSSDAL